MCNEPTRSTQDQARERNGMTPVEMSADAGHAAMSGGELIEAMVRITTDDDTEEFFSHAFQFGGHLSRTMVHSL